ncbi:hypothetical protein [Endothiovibrio diazotrophicus]
MTPLERVESLHRELVQHYHEARDAELRAATKLLLVAIAELMRHGGPGWHNLLNEYTQIARQDPERFRRMVQANRTNPGDPGDDHQLLC